MKYLFFALATLLVSDAHAQNSLSADLAAIKSKVMTNWSPPVNTKVAMVVEFQLGRDGKLSAPPAVRTRTVTKEDEAARDAAVRAIFKSLPFEKLNQNNYNDWKVLELKFDPAFRKRVPN